MGDARIETWEQVDCLKFNYVPGQQEKVQRSLAGVISINGYAARHMRLYTLVMSPRPAKYLPEAIKGSAEDMWNSAVHDSVFDATKLPKLDEAVFHRVDCGRRSADENLESTTKSFGVAVANWKTRHVAMVAVGVVVVSFVAVAVGVLLLLLLLLLLWWRRPRRRWCS